METPPPEHHVLVLRKLVLLILCETNYVSKCPTNLLVNPTPVFSSHARLITLIQPAHE